MNMNLNKERGECFMKNNKDYLELLKETNPIMHHFEMNKVEFFKKHLAEEQEELKKIRKQKTDDEKIN